MKGRRIFFILFSLTAMVLLNVSLISYCSDIAKLNRLLLAEDTLDTLRAQEISSEQLDSFREWEKAVGGVFSCYDYLCACLLTGETDRGSLERYIRQLKSYKEQEVSVLIGYLTAVWEDLSYFPVPLSDINKEADVSFVDSWMFQRTFGGKRGHEGCDIMADINERGRYPVVSMTDGIVEQIGWLTKGGYRIGIRSPHGGYFYYAHLYDYARDFQPGDGVKAGELLGFMGDSGYSDIEGTVGNFDVHLHVGIYVNQPDGTEMSINAYWPLKYLEGKRLKYSFY